MRITRVPILIFVTAVLVATALSREKKIKRSDLPPAVEKTVVAESAGAMIKGFSEEQEGGKTLYEAEMIVNGHTKDVLMDMDGTVVEVEEEVAVETLSRAVKTGLKAKAGQGKLVKVESLTKRGKLVAYEAQVETNGKKLEVQVGASGEALDHEE